MTSACDQFQGYYTVYMHICPNGWVYVGSTGKDPKRRWRNGHGYSRQPKFYEAIIKYGWDNIQHVIVNTYLTKKEAHTKERELTLANKDHCYNMKNTSDSVTAESKNRIRWQER